MSVEKYTSSGAGAPSSDGEVSSSSGSGEREPDLARILMDKWKKGREAFEGMKVTLYDANGKLLGGSRGEPKKKTVQPKRKQKKKSQRWEFISSIPFEENIPSEKEHARLKIPSLPKCYNVYKHVDVPREPVMTAEELEARYLKDLKEPVFMKVRPLEVPKKLPAKVELIDITMEARLLIVLKDSGSVAEFESMKKNLQYAFRNMKVRGWDVVIQPKDVIMNRLVVGMIDEKTELLRAKVTGFNGDLIHLYSIDYAFGFSLPYERVFYMPKMFVGYPAQIQEVHLTGLEKLEGTVFFKHIHHRIKKALTKMAEGLEADGAAENDAEGKVKANSDIRRYLFTLNGIEKVPNGEGYAVDVFMPDEIAKHVPLAKLITERLARLDPFKDFVFTC